MNKYRKTINSSRRCLENVERVVTASDSYRTAEAENYSRNLYDSSEIYSAVAKT